MVAQSDRAFRQLVRQNGCEMAYTQMIHAKNFVQNEVFRKNHLDVYPVKDSNAFDRPVSVQIAGYDPECMAKAAMDIYERCEGNLDAIDLNLGRPQAIARKGRYGAFLFLEDNDVVCNILRSMRKTLTRDVAITAKIRVLKDDSNNDAKLKDKILNMQNAGLDLLTVHGRNVKENKTAVREANWDKIKLVVDTLDITGAAGVMSSV